MMQGWQMDEQKEAEVATKAQRCSPRLGLAAPKPHTGQLGWKNSNKGTPDQKYTKQ